MMYQAKHIIKLHNFHGTTVDHLIIEYNKIRQGRFFIDETIFIKNDYDLSGIAIEPIELVRAGPMTRVGNWKPPPPPIKRGIN